MNGGSFCPLALLCLELPGVLRPSGTLTAGWKGNGCCYLLPASHPCPCQFIHTAQAALAPVLSQEAHVCPMYFSSLRDGRRQPWAEGHPRIAERSRWGVLIKEKLWAGSSAVVTLWDPGWALPIPKLNLPTGEMTRGPLWSLEPSYF